jgi:hypothetical protein
MRDCFCLISERKEDSVWVIREVNAVVLLAYVSEL